MLLRAKGTQSHPSAAACLCHTTPCTLEQCVCAGSLVLQLPTAEACHVACQLHTGGSEHLWSHVRARQGQKGLSPACALTKFVLGRPLALSEA